MDAKAKVVAWQYRWAGELPDGRSAEWHDCSEASFNEKTHEAMGYEYRALVPESALAELREQVDELTGAKEDAADWYAQFECTSAKYLSLLTGLEALAKRMYADAEDKDRHHEWKCCCDLYGGLLMTLHASTLASAGLEGK